VTDQKPVLEPYVVRIHEKPNHDRNLAIELHPRAGKWSPFVVGVPLTEKDAVRPSILHGLADTPPNGGMLRMTSSGPSADGVWWLESAQNEATPTQSYYLFCDRTPTRILFGIRDSWPLYEVFLQKK
jgi:hypothetical protein